MTRKSETWAITQQTSALFLVITHGLRKTLFFTQPVSEHANGTLAEWLTRCPTKAIPSGASVSCCIEDIIEILRLFFSFINLSRAKARRTRSSMIAGKLLAELSFVSTFSRADYTMLMISKNIWWRGRALDHYLWSDSLNFANPPDCFSLSRSDLLCSLRET